MEFIKIPLKQFIQSINSSHTEELKIDSNKFAFQDYCEYLELHIIDCPYNDVAEISRIYVTQTIATPNYKEIEYNKLILDLSIGWTDAIDTQILELAKDKLLSLLNIDDSNLDFKSLIQKSTSINIFYNVKDYLLLQETGESNSYIYIFLNRE
jgi:hypothetical protein